MLIGFGAIGLLLWVVPAIRTGDMAALSWTGRSGQWTALGLWGLGFVLCGIGLMAPTAAKPVYVFWMSVAVPIGIVMSTVLLTLLFVILLPVFSLIVRASDPLRRKLEPSKATYWERYKSQPPTLERMQRPF